MEVPPPADTELHVVVNTKGATQSDTNQFIHTTEGFPRRLNDPTLVIGYHDHVSFRL